ncbi:MAG: HPF/RaiA family ribosome-associated protein [Chryseolinea sp.]
MNIQFNTDKNINGSERFTAPYIAQIESELSRFSDHITRIEVHLSDEDGQKEGPNSKRCVLEARVERRQPIAVTNHSNSYGQAIGGALDKLTASLDTIMGKLSNHPDRIGKDV